MARFNFKTTHCAAALAFALAAEPAWALVTVEVSDAPGIEIDAEFPDDHVFDVPKGATVKLIKTTSGKSGGETHTIRGSYKGTLDDYIQRECWRPGSDCSPVNEAGGGTKGMEPPDAGGENTAPKH